MITPGTPYKWASVGFRSGQKRIRCGQCPDWRSWELSDSVDAQLERIAHEFSEAVGSATGEEDVRSALTEAAEAVRELADQKREGADNIESGFGHPTSQSEELTETAESLDTWADDIDNADVPEMPEPEPVTCEECNGKGGDCDKCEDGEVEPDSDDVIEQWRETVTNEVTIVDETPF